MGQITKGTKCRTQGGTYCGKDTCRAAAQCHEGQYLGNIVASFDELLTTMIVNYLLLSQNTQQNLGGNLSYSWLNNGRQFKRHTLHKKKSHRWQIHHSDFTICILGKQTISCHGHDPDRSNPDADEKPPAARITSRSASQVVVAPQSAPTVHNPRSPPRSSTSAVSASH